MSLPAANLLALAATPPPNILLLVIDSLDGRLLDPMSTVYGEVELPNLRAFAATAINFVRAYSANPVCVPSRTAMLTGLQPHRLQVFSNSDGLAASNGSEVLDARCVRLHGAAHCTVLREAQRGATTLLEELAARQYDVRAFGKLDCGSVCSENVACDSDWNGFHANPKEHWCALRPRGEATGSCALHAHCICTLHAHCMHTAQPHPTATQVHAGARGRRAAGTDAAADAAADCGPEGPGGLHARCRHGELLRRAIEIVRKIARARRRRRR